MEPEDNLDCADLIEKFMDNWEKSKLTSEKQGWLQRLSMGMLHWFVVLICKKSVVKLKFH